MTDVGDVLCFSVQWLVSQWELWGWACIPMSADGQDCWTISEGFSLPKPCFSMIFGYSSVWCSFEVSDFLLYMWWDECHTFWSDWGGAWEWSDRVQRQIAATVQVLLSIDPLLRLTRHGCCHLSCITFALIPGSKDIRKLLQTCTFFVSHTTCWKQDD